MPLPKSRVVQKLNRLFEPQDSMDTLLQQAARMAGKLMRAECCSIVWLTEDQRALRIRAQYRKPTATGIVLRLGATVPFFPSTANGSSLDRVDLGLHDGSLELDSAAAPLHVNNHVVAYLHVLRRKAGWGDGGRDEDYFTAICQQVGWAIEMQQMRQMLASRYATAVVPRDRQADPSGHDTLGSHILAAVQDPEKIAKIIARSFYKDLRRAGFEPRQILVVASEIIENLNEAFRRTQAKAEESE